MLMAMRRSANNIFVKILLIAAAVAFAFWGVASWIVADVTAQHIAVVGGDKLPYALFEARLRSYIQRIETITGSPVVENTAEYESIRRNILTNMVQNKLLEKRSADLGIRIGDDVLQREIIGERSFSDENGAFDAAKFNQYLQSTGQNKRDFFNGLRTSIQIEFLRRLFGYSPAIPPALVNDIVDYRYEGRVADVLPIPFTTAEAEGEPSETDLIELYKENARLFFTPEFREINYVLITPDLLKKEVATDDSLLRPFYDQNVDDYYVEELRHLVQYRFNKEEEARAAYDEITAAQKANPDAKLFAADDSGLSDKYIKMRSDAGTFRRDELMNDFREKVFAAPNESYVEPIKSPFGWHIFYIKDVQEEHLGEFEEVKDKLKNDYIQSKLEIRYPEFIGTAEDKLAEGASVEELAQSLGAEAQKAAIDANANSKQGTPAEFFADKSELTATIFATDERGVPSSAIPVGDGSEYIVFELNDVKTARTKSLDEVRGKVVELWKDIKRRKKIHDAVEAALAEKDDAASAMQALSDQFATPIESGVEVRRPMENGLPQVKEYLNAESAEKLFFVPLGEVAVGDNLDARQVIVMHSLKKKTAEELAGKNRLRSEKETWKQNFTEDFLFQYLRYLEDFYGVKYNEDLL